MQVDKLLVIGFFGWLAMAFVALIFGITGVPFIAATAIPYFTVLMVFIVLCIVELVKETK